MTSAAKFAGVVGITLLAGVHTLAQDTKMQRGRYLVEEVARCRECHTPRTDSGDFDTAKSLKGAKLNIAAITPVKDWHAQSPDITSTSPLWQRWGDEGMSKFLQTAKNPRGNSAGAPMPAYTMKAEDAEAIVAYLKSLP